MGDFLCFRHVFKHPSVLMKPHPSFSCLHYAPLPILEVWNVTKHILQIFRGWETIRSELLRRASLDHFACWEPTSLCFTNIACFWTAQVSALHSKYLNNHFISTTQRAQHVRFLTVILRPNEAKTWAASLKGRVGPCFGEIMLRYCAQQRYLYKYHAMQFGHGTSNQQLHQQQHNNGNNNSSNDKANNN